MARKSRKNPETVVRSSGTDKAIYKAALYARISVENERKRESDTIGNQIMLLRDYVSQHQELSFVDVYCDDNITGMSFDRPEFARMMNDIRRNVVNCVIVKDFSRLGRNMLESGEYIEQIFPRMKVRFISVTDRFDSLCDEADLSVQLKNFANEMYARDISKKIRSVKRSQQEKGMLTGGQVPYGYVMDPDIQGHLIVDPKTAPIVLEIFRLYAEGNSMHFISRVLNEQEVPSPGKYLFEHGQRKSDKFKNSIWYMGTIKKILTNTVYIGWIVSGKYQSQLLETGLKRCKLMPEENWIINKGMHEPIVSKGLFDEVQAEIEKRQQSLGHVSVCDAKYNAYNKFRGILRCGECGRAMQFRRKSNGDYYICAIHESYGTDNCPKKAVRAENVESMAFRLIQSQIYLFTDARKTISLLNSTASVQNKMRIYETQLVDIRGKIEMYSKLKASLYGDYSEGTISLADFTALSNDYDEKADELRIFASELETEKAKFEADYGTHTKWAELISQYEDQTTLSADMAAAFIDSLTLYNDGHAEIAFNFIDEMNQILLLAAERGKEAERYV